ncbi:Ubiquitin [Lasiodiplodia theobromae]|uniref:Ubiquitin-like modifier HUB1 n=1 Tax=Lasiodiplodia theobromae TaxID=45133 RepID=A0A5N5DIF4_9PEZI|nr:Ubiquitin [Lasiodiplodia theobromae]KAB2577623.1 Ubiquitin-like modifier HUB1 [Lasiodiplodia theobromae]KAF4535504.1 Ubiquitin [Lasiodiplodia theobromae]KAF9638784.1 Ubiquitin [Lasiodiplodia theobromae]
MPSPSPTREREEDRPRNRSRDRDRDRPRKTGGGGFRWKEKPSRAVFEEERDRDRGGAGDDKLQRGYRANRSPPRRRYDDDDRRDRRDDSRGDRDRGDYRRRSRSPRDRERRDRRREEKRREVEDDRLGVADKFGGGAAAGPRKEGRKEKKPQPKVAPTQEPMIIVTVNDRLGTKAQIPCLASDPIKLFKAQVAARIGRQPHEIMLKRQGERPFKDQLTLEDYGVSNGVQLDLELDTGD